MLSLESTGGAGGEAAEDQEEIPVVAWLDIVEYVENGFLSLFYTVRRRKANDEDGFGMKAPSPQ